MIFVSEYLFQWATFVNIVSIKSIFFKNYLVKICPIFVRTHPSASRLKRFLSECSFWCKNLLNFTWNTMKFHNHQFRSWVHPHYFCHSKEVITKQRTFYSKQQLSGKLSCFTIDKVLWPSIFILHITEARPSFNESKYLHLQNKVYFCTPYFWAFCSANFYRSCYALSLSIMNLTNGF